MESDVRLEDIHEKYLALDLKDRIMTKTELHTVLTLFRRFNLFDLIDRDISQGDSQIIIYRPFFSPSRLKILTKSIRRLKPTNKGVWKLKTLTRVKLINWHYFVNETIEIHNNALVTGENGAGKSTLLYMVI